MISPQTVVFSLYHQPLIFLISRSWNRSEFSLWPFPKEYCFLTPISLAALYFYFWALLKYSLYFVSSPGQSIKFDGLAAFHWWELSEIFQIRSLIPDVFEVLSSFPGAFHMSHCSFRRGQGGSINVLKKKNFWVRAGLGWRGLLSEIFSIETLRGNSGL